jgi:hypothetical protein
VLDDLLDGMITSDDARRDYGVVVDKHGRIDLTETNRLRALRPRNDSALTRWVIQLRRPTISRVTDAKPEKPNTRAAAGVTSMTRPATNGPRSLIRTITERPLR